MDRLRVNNERRLERETGIEPATSSLGSLRSTAELLPQQVSGDCTTNEKPGAAAPEPRLPAGAPEGNPELATTG